MPPKKTKAAAAKAAAAAAEAAEVQAEEAQEGAEAPESAQEGDDAPEGQEAEEHAEEDMVADEAPEGEADWANCEPEADGSVHGENDLAAEDEDHPEEEDQEMADGDGDKEEEGDKEEGDKEEGAADGNGTAEGAEEYEVVDELDDDEGLLDEMEKEIRGDRRSKSREGSASKDKDGKEGGEKKDEKRVTRRHPFFIPTAYEYKIELRKQWATCCVLMGPVTFSDLSDEKLAAYIHKTQKVSVKFGKMTPGDSFVGYLELVFFSETEAAECAKELEGHREGFNVQHTDRENKSTEISSIREYGDIFAGKTGESTVVIPELTSTVKEEEIAAQIPEAKQVFIPISLQTSRKKRYAYVEMADVEAVGKVEGKEITIQDEVYKVYKLENMPSYINVLKQIRTLRFQQMMAQLPLDAGQKSQLFKLSMAVTHYMRVDYLDRKQLDDLKLAAEPLRRLLRVNAMRGNTRGRPSTRYTRRPVSGYRGSVSRGRSMSTSGYRTTDSRYTRGGVRAQGEWSDRRSSTALAPRKRRSDDYDSSYTSSYADKRSRDDSYRSSRRDDYGASYDDGDRHRGRDDDLDMDPRQAVNILMGLTSMLKGSSRRDDPRDTSRYSSSRGLSSSPRGSSYRGSSSSYRGSSSSYRGSSSSYRGSSSRGASTYRGSSSRGGYTSRY